MNQWKRNEIKALVQNFIEEKGVSKITVFYQNDTYGKTGLEVVIGQAVPYPYDRRVPLVAE